MADHDISALIEELEDPGLTIEGMIDAIRAGSTPERMEQVVQFLCDEGWMRPVAQAGLGAAPGGDVQQQDDEAVANDADGQPRQEEELEPLGTPYTDSVRHQRHVQSVQHNVAMRDCGAILRGNGRAEIYKRLRGRRSTLTMQGGLFAAVKLLDFGFLLARAQYMLDYPVARGPTATQTREAELVVAYNSLSERGIEAIVLRFFVAHSAFVRMADLVLEMENNPDEFDLGQGQPEQIRLSKAIDMFATHEQGGLTPRRHEKWKTIRGLGERLDMLVSVYGKGILAVFPFHEIRGVMGGGDSERRFDAPMLASFLEILRLSDTHHNFLLEFSERVGEDLLRLVYEANMPANQRAQIELRLGPRLQAFVPGVLRATNPYSFPQVTKADWDAMKGDSWLANRAALPKGYRTRIGDLQCPVNSSNAIDTLKPGRFLDSDAVMSLMMCFVKGPWNFVTGPALLDRGVDVMEDLTGDRFLIPVLDSAEERLWCLLVVTPDENDNHRVNVDMYDALDEGDGPARRQRVQIFRAFAEAVFGEDRIARFGPAPYDVRVPAPCDLGMEVVMLAKAIVGSGDQPFDSRAYAARHPETSYQVLRAMFAKLLQQIVAVNWQDNNYRRD
ncbi:hypothetical protein PG991_012129 [Apiospora marii]|uniref:Uncharacterized protein n=1 Tax=Apiospora marii TaxID=335849 RepID=A0ABR1R9A6_9PEZI